ncbi:MAG: hypothetical protein QM775_20890 [Pirellulales bacterium]
MSFYFRTHATDLSDDGLMLLDALFDHGGTPIRLLREVNFRPQWNLPFAHSLSDVELLELLRSYVGRGIVTISDDCDARNYCAITPLGGALWEAERKPVWDRYAFGREKSKMNADGEHVAHVVLTSYFRSSAAAAEFVNNCRTLGIDLAGRGRIRHHVAKRLPGVVEWKNFDDWQVVAILIRDCDPNDREQKSTWVSDYDKVYVAERNTLTWHNVRELQRFL